MKILAIDLAWTGPSGWVLWDGARLHSKGWPDPIIKYGEFKVTPKRGLTGAGRRTDIGRQIQTAVRAVLRENPADLLVYEETDWHQGLSGQRDWKQKYAQERQVQRSLAAAEMALLLATAEMSVPAASLGASEAAKEYGVVSRKVQKKEMTAMLLANSLGYRLAFEKHKTGYVLDKLDGSKLSHHITDAMMLAEVMYNRIRVEEMTR
jgi:hypothetical protein